MKLNERVHLLLHLLMRTVDAARAPFWGVVLKQAHVQCSCAHSMASEQLLPKVIEKLDVHRGYKVG